MVKCFVGMAGTHGSSLSSAGCFRGMWSGVCL